MALRAFSLLLLASLAAPFLTACGGGGGAGGGAPGGGVSASLSSVVIDVPFGTAADGIEIVTITVTVLDGAGDPVQGRPVLLGASGSANILVQPPLSDANGVAIGTLATTFAETKTISATVTPGAGQVLLDDMPTTDFVRVLPGARYVRRTGSDTSDGTSPLTAWSTLSFAATQLVPGDTLFVGAGTYTESVDLVISGTSADPIRFFADRDGSFTGDAGEVVVDALGGAYAFGFSGVSWIELRGFVITGATPGPSDGGGVLVGPSQSSDITLYDCDIWGNERGVALRDAENVVLEDVRITNNLGPTADAIVVQDGGDVSILNCLVYNNGGSGVRIEGQTNDLVIDVCTFFRNGGDQILEIAAGNEGTVTNCIVSEGAADGIHVRLGSSFTESHNLFWANAGDDFDDEAGGGIAATSLASDPLLAEPFGLDGLLGGPNATDDSFLLELGSPGFDAGDQDVLAKVLPNGGVLAGFTTRRDGTLDGSGDDGSILNIGYHYPVPPDPFDSLAGGDARVYYARSPEVQVVSRAWDLDGREWSDPARTAPTSSRIVWMANAVSQGPGPEELLGVLTDDGLNTRFFVRHWDGVRWSEDDVYDPFDSDIRSERSGQRGFDVEFEGVSGDGLVVRSNDTENPVYRTLQDGVWSDELPVFQTPPGTGPVLWIELAARPGTDEIACVVLDEHQKLTAAIWDGSAWDPSAEVLLDVTIAELFLSKSFDAAYESVSGDLLVAWGYTKLIEETRFATKAAGTTSWNIQQDFSTDAVGTVVRMAAERSTDRIVIGYGEVNFDDDVVGLIWDGAQLFHNLEIDDVASPAGADIGVAWAGDAGVAVFLYRDTDGTGTLDWAAWTPLGWRVKNDVIVPGLGDFVSAEMRSIPGENRLMSIYADDSGALHAFEFDGDLDAWTHSNGGVALDLGLDLTLSPADPFVLGFREQ